jgi:dTDP-glucose 4,6-dehydratase
MQTWLITGGAGFIGANFVRLARARPQTRLLVLDALTYAGDPTRLEGCLAPPEAELVRGDIRDAGLVEKLFRERSVTHVVHFAAESHVDRSILGPQAFIQTNIEGTFTLLEAARQHWKEPSGKLFLHVSTDEVFGSLGPQDPPFHEETPYHPSSPYSASKAASDHLVRAWHHTYGLPMAISNCSNNYGPWQFPEKLIPLIILNALEGKDLPVYGDGMQVRDWLHVEDHCEALLAILERGVSGRTYTIGGHDERPNLEIIKRVCDAVDALTGKPPGQSQRLIRHVTDRPGHDRRYAIDASRIRNELGWQPRHQLETALPELVRWYVEHKSWADAVRSGEYKKFYRQLYGERV